MTPANRLDQRFIDDIGGVNGHLKGCICKKCGEYRDMIKALRLV